MFEEKEELVRQKEKESPSLGFTPIERRHQFRKNRHKDSFGYQRRSEADKSKIQYDVHSFTEQNTYYLTVFESLLPRCKNQLNLIGH